MEAALQEVPDLDLAFAVELSEAVICLAVSTHHVAVGTVDDNVIVLDRESGQVLHTLAGHAGGTNSLAFCKGGLLFTAGEDGKATLWNVAAGGAMFSAFDVEGTGADRTTDGHTVSHVAVSRNGRQVACAAGRTVHLFDLQADNLEAARQVYPDVASTVEDLKFTHNGLLIAACYGGITYWSPDVEVPGLELPYSGAVLAADMAKGMKWFVAGCYDSTVHIWHLPAGTRVIDGGLQVEELSCAGYESKVTLCHFDKQGQYLASSGGRRCTVWDFNAGGPAGSVPTCTLGHEKMITCQAWQPDASGSLVTGSEDGRALVYDVRQLTAGKPNLCIPKLMAEAHGDAVTQVGWGTGGCIYTGHMSGHVRLWKPPATTTHDSEAQVAASAQSEPGEPSPDAATSNGASSQPKPASRKKKKKPGKNSYAHR
ncbi:hypothetical protein WJX72_010923 [[Myrmecia] bisecta]|uniref:Uncharacterized protein n=1 Tax=[Myrmecia] bisecta TaxID=41462 RepID=A0AAW1PQQ3_9CHLO